MRDETGDNIDGKISTLVTLVHFLKPLINKNE
jgi:hypothetical protein